MVSIVEIDAVVFNILPDWLENAYARPKNWTSPPKWEQYQ